MASITLTIDSPEQLKQLLEQQLAHGGLFLPTAVQVERGGEVDIELSLPFSRQRSLCFTGTVLNVMEGSGFAVSLEQAALLKVRRYVNSILQGPSEGSSAGATPEAVMAGMRDESRKKDFIRRLPTREKLLLALRGDRQSRGILIQETNNAIHPNLLQNPRLSIEEVQKLAGSPKLNGSLLKYIAKQREYIRNHSIVKALVRNYKTPAPIAIELLEKLSINELREISGISNMRPAVREKAKWLLKRRLLRSH